MRAMILSLIVAVGLLLSFGAQTSRAQAPYPVTTPPYVTTPGGSWSGYAPVSPFEGYRPGLPWSGYNPPPAVTGTTPPVTPIVPTPPPPFTSRPSTATTYVAPGLGGVTVTRPATRRQPYFPGTRLMTAPAYYREYGTGRNVYLAKPWLPNQ